MFSTKLQNCQDQGFVSGSNNINEANRCIAEARKATPEASRHLFRSYIRFDRKDGGYEWGWILK